MPNSHLENTEIVLGLIMEGRQAKHGFSPDVFDRAYTKIAEDVLQGKPVEELITLHGSSTVQSLLHAAHSVNGLGEGADWRAIMKESYHNRVAAEKLKKITKKLENGLPVDPEKVREAFTSILHGEKSKSVRASEIDGEYTPFIKSGMTAWDEHIGGLPAVGMVVLAGLWSSGKTTNAISIMDCYLREYPDREVLFVTLEDMNEGWKARAKVMLEKRSNEFWERIHVMEFAENATDIIAEASRWDKVGLVVVDYIDYMSKADNASFDEMYQTLSMGAKEIAVNREFRACTVVALAQINKGNYNGGVPEEKCLPYNAGQRYTYQLAMMYNSNADFHAENPDNPYYLPAVPGHEYLVFWKVKNGCRPHIGEFPGAIRLPWTNAKGFAMDNAGEWVALTNETKRPVSNKRK